jgi:hypothetical protein
VLGFILVLALIGTHFYFLVNPDRLPDAAAAADRTQSLLVTVWQGIVPVAQSL